MTDDDNGNGDIARASLREERQAVRDYGERAARAKSPQLRAAIRHIRNEERQHVRQLRRHARRR